MKGKMAKKDLPTYTEQVEARLNTLIDLSDAIRVIGAGAPQFKSVYTVSELVGFKYTQDNLANLRGLMEREASYLQMHLGFPICVAVSYRDRVIGLWGNGKCTVSTSEEASKQEVIETTKKLQYL